MRRRFSGFSLLEMMVAIALLSMGLVILLQVQARSMQLAQQAREMTVATMLARSKSLDCENDLLKKGFSIGDYDQDGNFEDDGYPTFYWECHAYKPNMPDPDAGGSPDMGSALGALGAGDTANALQSQGPSNQGMGDVGMSFLGPMLSQMSGILGDSIRELVVIVRWGKGDDMQEMTVTRHVIDKTPVNQVAGMIAAQAGALGSLTGQGQNGQNGQNNGPPASGAQGAGNTPPSSGLPVPGGNKIGVGK
jgi:prepilin-type N-terminal cleavage/methylation domain-containing protein